MERDRGNRLGYATEKQLHWEVAVERDHFCHRECSDLEGDPSSAEPARARFWKNCELWQRTQTMLIYQCRKAFLVGMRNFETI